MSYRRVEPPVELTIGVDEEWTDIDVSALVSARATVVQLLCVNLYATTTIIPTYFRKKGSTDAYLTGVYGNSQKVQRVGLDDNKVFQAYTNLYSQMQVLLIGYFEAEAVWFTNAVNITPGSAASWEDVDITAQLAAGDPCVAAMVLYTNPSGNAGFRVNGSTDDRYMYEYSFPHAIVGVDAGNVFEAKLASISGSYKLYLLGYLRGGAVFNSNAVDVSLGTKDLWTNLAALPAGALAGIYEAYSTFITTYGLRPEGSTTEILKRGAMHSWPVANCDDAGLVEHRISDTRQDMYLSGYLEPAPEYDDASLPPSPRFPVLRGLGRFGTF